MIDRVVWSIALGGAAELITWIAQQADNKTMTTEEFQKLLGQRVVEMQSGLAPDIARRAKLFDERGV